MLNLKKLIASAEECLGWPYVSPGTNNSQGIDCSGLFVKCFRDQGASIYHGSNTIYRKYCSDKGKLTSVSQLKPGMAVFKWNSNTPAKFNDDLGDFQHIGLVTGVNPLRIVHASSAAGCVTTDTKIGKWAYWGKLNNVDYGESTSGTDESEDTATTECATGYITTDKVNFRTGPSTKKPRIDYLNTGDMVEIMGESGAWLKCKINGRVGYIDNRFVSNTPVTTVTEETVAQETTQDEPEPILEPTQEEKNVLINADNGGRVNIRAGNGFNYGKITSVQSGTTLPYIATAANGWLAVKVKNVVGWVSPEYAGTKE